MLLYEEGPNRQGHDSLVAIDHPVKITDLRTVGGIEQRSSLYGLLTGKDKVT